MPLPQETAKKNIMLKILNIEKTKMRKVRMGTFNRLLSSFFCLPAEVFFFFSVILNMQHGHNSVRTKNSCKDKWENNFRLSLHTALPHSYHR